MYAEQGHEENLELFPHAHPDLHTQTFRTRREWDLSHVDLCPTPALPSISLHFRTILSRFHVST